VSGSLSDGAPGTATVGCVGALSHDSFDNLYFIDGLADNTNQLRKRALDGTISTVPGAKVPFLLAGNYEIRLAADETGNVYISNTILGVYLVTPQGVTTRVVGSQAQAGDLLVLPAGIKLDNVRAVRYVGNRQLLVTSGQSVLKITLP
jgi:hypothetical protein